jgi:hypothetical protein
MNTWPKQVLWIPIETKTDSLTGKEKCRFSLDSIMADNIMPPIRTRISNSILNRKEIKAMKHQTSRYTAYRGHPRGR